MQFYILEGKQIQIRDLVLELRISFVMDQNKGNYCPDLKNLLLVCTYQEYLITSLRHYMEEHMNRFHRLFMDLQTVLKEV